MAANIILPAVALKNKLRSLICSGKVGHSVADCKIGNVRLLVQHDIFFLFGSKRVVTIRIRAGLAAVILFAVDVVEFVKAAGRCKLYNKFGGSGKIVGCPTHEDRWGVRKGDFKFTIVYFGQLVAVSNILRRG